MSKLGLKDKLDRLGGVTPTSCPLSSKGVSIVKYNGRHVQPSSRHDRSQLSETGLAVDSTSLRISLNPLVRRDRGRSRRI